MAAHEKATSFELAARPEVALSQQKYHSIIHEQKQSDKLFCIDWGLAVRIARKRKEAGHDHK